jgi:hypothetical protein
MIEGTVDKQRHRLMERPGKDSNNGEGPHPLNSGEGGPKIIPVGITPDQDHPHGRKIRGIPLEGGIKTIIDGMGIIGMGIRLRETETEEVRLMEAKGRLEEDPTDPLFVGTVT